MEHSMTNPLFPFHHVSGLSYPSQDQEYPAQPAGPYGMYTLSEGPTSDTVLPPPAQPAFTDSQIPHPVDPFPAQGKPPWHHVQPSSGARDVPTLSMAPPANSRKRKAPTLRSEAWDPYRDCIVQLHITEDRPLPEVKSIMEERFGFTAEIRQYRTRITQWGLDKNIKPKEMEAVVRKRQRRKLVESDKKELVFTVRGITVAPEKIDRWMKKKAISESTQYAPSPAASTPSAVNCWTPSDRDLSAPSPTYSVGTPIPSVPDALSRGQSTYPSSPASSITSIIRSTNSTFTGQSPAPFPSTLDNSVEVQGTSPAQPHPGPPFYAPSHAAEMMPKQSSTETIRHRYRYEDETRLRQELSRLEALYGKDHLNTLPTVKDLAEVLYHQGRYKSTEEHIRRVVKTYQTERGENDINTLSAFTLLGYVLERQGFSSKAEKIHQKTLSIQRDRLGHEHQDTLFSMTRLANVYTEQGRLEEAEDLYLQLVRHGDMKVKGDLASVYRRQERLEEAEKLMVVVVEVHDRHYGKEHSTTLRSKERLASIYTSQGRQEEAEKIQVDVLEISQRVFGKEHPDTLIIMVNLAMTYDSQGRWKEAEELGLQVLETQKRVLGLEHPHTLTTMSNLALTYRRQGRLKEAEELGLQVIETRKRVLGLENPDTLTTMSNLALNYELQGRLKEAEELGLQVIETRKRVLGLEHPHTLDTMGNLALTYESQGRGKEAEELRKQVMELKSRAREKGVWVR